MITPQSRYRDCGTEVIASHRGSLVTILPREPQVWRFQFTDYKWTGADRLDLLASRYFGDARMWWVMADANPEILDWSDIQPGTVIRVPSV